MPKGIEKFQLDLIFKFMCIRVWVGSNLTTFCISFQKAVCIFSRVITPWSYMGSFPQTEYAFYEINPMKMCPWICTQCPWKSNDDRKAHKTTQ